jgi:uncharacterized protein YbbK (DUF523 family)/uncharacterized protein YbgA (DUF1722 family)
MDRVRLGISSCLLGRPVRFDGGHKRDVFLTETLDSFVDWIPICPEVGVGLSTPRPALRLVDRDGDIAMVTRDGDSDITEAMRSYSKRTVAGLKRAGIDGYVLKKDSPSCGLERVRVYNHNGQPRRDGRGLFATALIEAMPDLPVEEEGRLNDPTLREAFFERVYANRRMTDLLSNAARQVDLERFHAAHKLQLMAHSPDLTPALGRIVATGAGLERTGPSYEGLFRRILSRPVSRGRHVNVLHHALGYFKRALGDMARHDLLGAVSAFERGDVPLVVPVTLLSHRARDEGIEYLAKQTYLSPYPEQIGLRNAV